jgi:hypothetical protein
MKYVKSLRFPLMAVLLFTVLSVCGWNNWQHHQHQHQQRRRSGTSGSSPLPGTQSSPGALNKVRLTAAWELSGTTLNAAARRG